MPSCSLPGQRLFLHPHLSPSTLLAPSLLAFQKGLLYVILLPETLSALKGVDEWWLKHPVDQNLTRLTYGKGVERNTQSSLGV